jgi:amino acid adenylation domain-containing protein
MRLPVHDQESMSDRMGSQRLLWNGFVRSAAQFPDRAAIELAGYQVSYERLADKAKSLAATLQAHTAPDAVPLTAVFVHRSETAYAAVLGALMAGRGYVPLNRTFPVDRTRLMLEKSRCRSLIVDAASEQQLDRLLCGIIDPLLIICPDCADVTEVAAKFPLHRFIAAHQLVRATEWRPINVNPDSIAYLLFTSGSTGEPKGVMISHANVLHYVDCVTNRYGFTCRDRLSQTFDLTFDLSVHDMFVTWEAGACLCCPTQKQTIKPDAYVKDARLTVWFSVPATAMFMRRLGVLKSNMYPGLRLSLFCGEALPVALVSEWALAAPNSAIENLYGPTELTIACTAYRWQEEESLNECELGIVPIGAPLDNMQALVVDEHLQEVPVGTDGELLMTGPQLSLGYWQDDEKTRRAFVEVAGRKATYYRTGDRVRQRGVGEPLLYLGRVDSQIKILGHRIELGEIEGVVRQVSGVEGVVAVGWPLSEGGAEAIEVFLETDHCDTRSLTIGLKEKLPMYMVPRHLRLLSSFPKNSNGKYDRKALQAILQSGHEQAEKRCAISSIA